MSQTLKRSKKRILHGDETVIRTVETDPDTDTLFARISGAKWELEEASEGTKGVSYVTTRKIEQIIPPMGV